MSAPDDPAGFDESRYADWFAWAKDALGRDLDATHAAAEAGYTAFDTGQTRDAAEAAARGAGDEPTHADARAMALAEWAYWARTELHLDPGEALVAAKRALEALETSHSLEAAMGSVDGRGRAQTPAAHAPTARPAPPESGFWRSHWQAVVGLMAASAVVGALATAGVMIGVTPTEPASKQPDVPAAGATVVVVVTGSDATVRLTGFPPESPVFVLIDGTQAAVVNTDGSGAADLTVPFPLGGHTVSACLDPTGGKCLATGFATRDQ